MWTFPFIENLWQDLRYGARLLWINPGFALVAIFSLALGIGANTAIFQLLDAVRLRTLPIQRPQELAEVKIAGGGNMGIVEGYGELTRPIWEELRRDHPAFSDVFAWSKEQMSLGEGAGLQHVNGIAVSGDFFRVLGVQPWRGRLTLAELTLDEDEHPCPETTAVVSHAVWQSKMGGRPIDANSRMLINGRFRQIVGVMPPSFFGLIVGERADVVFPFCRPKEWARDHFELTVMGRLRPGWKVARASAQLAAQSPAIMAATEIMGYDASTVHRYRAFRLAAFPASSGVSRLREEYDSSLWLLFGTTGLVLLIACANLANLMLARASTREREIAVRLALGAARGRLLRQLLVESSLLAFIGTALGIGLAGILSSALVHSLSTSNDTVTLATGMNWSVLLFAVGIAALTCLVFGVAPAIRASSADPVTAMKTGGRGLTASRERFSLQRTMVVAQISISLVLLVGALLFVRSFRNLMTLDTGIREDGITLATISFDKSNIVPVRLEDFRRELADDVNAVPGVLSAATTTVAPLLGGSWHESVTIGSTEGDSAFTWVSPRYFETMGIPFLYGRGFDRNDTGTSQRVAIVNQEFIHRYLNGINPIGRSMRTHPEPDYPSTLYRIVGIVPDTRHKCLRCDIPPSAFAPASQFPARDAWTDMVIHSNQPPAAIMEAVRRSIAKKHPEIVTEFHVYQTQIRDGLVRDRVMALLSGFFGLLAALLAMMGLYGVISYIVTRRRNEIGIRVALGASRSQVIGMVMREAGVLLAAGLVIGAFLSLAAGRGANSLLFGLKPYDPLTLATAILLLAVIAALASYFPARRASNLDPMAALRCD